MKLNEVVKTTKQRAMLLNAKPGLKEWADRWLTDTDAEWRVTKDGKIDVINGNVHLSFNCLVEGVLPYSFGTCYGNFKILQGPTSKNLKTMVGCPKIVGGDFSIFSRLVVDIEGIPQIVGGQINFVGTNIESLSEIHKKLKECRGEIITLPSATKSSVLRLLLIKRLLIVRQLLPKKVGPEIRWSNILNKHLQGDRDVLACQEELISAGFKEFAKL